MLITNKKETLIKHSAAVHISNDINVLERKVYNVLLKNAYNELSTKNQYSMKLNDIALEVGWKAENFVPQHFKNSIVKLVKTNIQWNILGKDKKTEWNISTLIASAKIKNGVVYYTYSEELRYLLARPNIYTILDLKYQKLLKSKYSLALWEFCCEQLDTSKVHNVLTEYVTLEKLKEILGANKEAYNLFKEFNKSVLKPSIKEINDKTDLDIEIHSQKHGKKIVACAFKVHRKVTPIISQKNMFDIDIDAIDLVTRTVELENIFSQGKKLKLTQEQVEQFLLKHEAKKLSSVFNFIIEKIKEGNVVKNIVGYTWTLLNRSASEIKAHENTSVSVVDLNIDKENQRKILISNIENVIQKVKDPIQRGIFIGIRKVLPPLLMSLALEDKGGVILSIEDQGETKNIKIKGTVRFGGYEDLIKNSIIYTLAESNISSYIEIIKTIKQ